ncbi:MAG: hypothetical protein ACOCRX_02055 [Candidatus Woesearchaeota archaeon]
MVKQKEKEPLVHLVVFMSVISIILIVLYASLNQVIDSHIIITISVLGAVIYLTFIINKKFIITPTEKAKKIFDMSRLSTHHYDDQVKHLKSIVEDRKEYRSGIEKDIEKEGYVNENN